MCTSVRLLKALLLAHIFGHRLKAVFQKTVLSWLAKPDPLDKRKGRGERKNKVGKENDT